jgi:hypothetical protein
LTGKQIVPRGSALRGGPLGAIGRGFLAYKILIIIGLSGFLKENPEAIIEIDYERMGNCFPLLLPSMGR